MQDDKALLLDMLIASRKIQRYIHGIRYEVFLRTDIIQSAVEWELQVIGEAARGISEDTRYSYSELPWSTMIGMRNRLVHGYATISLEVVWDTITNDVPALSEQLANILEEE